jgi:hypothetical protein
MHCPRRGCRGTLARWGYGRRRHIRGLGAAAIDVRPRRVRCGSCGATQVLLPAALQPRRADATEVTGAALGRKAAGMGHRQIAAAAWWARQRLGTDEPLWTLIGLHTGGRLFAPPG